MGFDLNRHWQDPSPWAHPTLHATKQLVMQYDKDPVSQIALDRPLTESTEKPYSKNQSYF